MTIAPATKSRIRAALEIAGGIAILVLAVLLYTTYGQLDTSRAETIAERKAHETTVANHRRAQAEAERADAENRARIEAEQRAANERISHEYEARIAAARADYERLLRERARAGNGGAGSAAVPARPGAAAGVDGAATEGGFPLADRLIATEQAIQLEELQRYVRETIAIINGQPEN